MISFDFYSTHYKVYIHLPCITKQRRKKSPFGIAHFISSSNFRTPRLYQGSANRCEGDSKSNIIRLLQPFQTIHYYNQSVLVIVPDLNRFVWSITILISFWEAPWYSSFLLRSIYLYNLMGTKVLQFWFVTRLTSSWSSLSQVSALYCYS